MFGFNDLTEGYFDGRASDLNELPEGSNRSESYKAGWKNGRDDRLLKPRASAEEIRTEVEEVVRVESGYL